MSRCETKLVAFATALLISVTNGGAALAQKQEYGPGANDAEIKIGNIMPYSGPVSAYSIMGKIEDAYFKMINDEGGLNGRKVKFISYDDAYSPPKTVEQARKLVEGDEVLFIFNPMGTPPNVAIHKYLNAKKVPQLFVSSGSSKWNDPEHFPWTMGWPPSNLSEGRVYGRYLAREAPTSKIAVFYQNDDYGKELLQGVQEGLGDKASSLIVAAESYETSEPSIDSHIVKLKASGADVMVNASLQKFAAQSIKKMAEIGWKPIHIISNLGSSVSATLQPAGLDNSQGIISAIYFKDPSDPSWKDDAGVKEYETFLSKYLPGANPYDIFGLNAYTLSKLMVHVLKQCGDDLTRENLMKQAANVKDLQLNGLLPGILINTSPTDLAQSSSTNWSNSTARTGSCLATS
jgi:branched-chain amino acid transport system substrate-binding protein